MSMPAEAEVAASQPHTPTDAELRRKKEFIELGFLEEELKYKKTLTPEQRREDELRRERREDELWRAELEKQRLQVETERLRLEARRLDEQKEQRLQELVPTGGWYGVETLPLLPHFFPSSHGRPPPPCTQNLHRGRG
jgi:hypothetical protein